MPKYVCGWCGKYSYTSRNAARDAARKISKNNGQSSGESSIYRCHFDRHVYHVTSWSKDRTDRYQRYVRTNQPRNVAEEQVHPVFNMPVTEASYWRWYMFDALSRFGVRSAKTIKLPPARWAGIVNRSPWAVPATVTVTIRKRNRRRNRT